ncbi:uncharacterized protein LOC115230356 [Octopus sinensis]|uniref:Uncharacterized protein LOC115230356 n=1 Tax=Octopus sinensis TaxID=2607531 RepID=A0A6P7U615_9MOLL|nr:uncharacterized protein LOC115230356 [Octopus sinensis]
MSNVELEEGEIPEERTPPESAALGAQISSSNDKPNASTTNKKRNRGKRNKKKSTSVPEIPKNLNRKTPKTVKKKLNLSNKSIYVYLRNSKATNPRVKCKVSKVKSLTRISIKDECIDPSIDVCEDEVFVFLLCR